MKIIPSIVFVVSVLASSSTSAAEPVSSGYAPVDGLQLYYEIHGTKDSENPPLVLLHGGGDTINTSFGHVLSALAASRQVIAFEQQGFGHTADIKDRPFTFEQSADDTAALLDHLKINQADFLGFSNGGTIGLQVAIRHPQFARKLVAISTFFSRAGGAPEFWDSMKNASPTMMPAELKEAYLKVAPHPENFESFFYKCAYRMRDFEDIPVEAIRGIKAPTMVINGDRDVVLLEHAVELFRLLPDSQVAILPGTDHMQIMTRKEILVPMVERFLDTPLDEK